MLVSTLKLWERLLTQLFTPGLLLKALWSKTLSTKIYHFKAASQRDMTMLAFIRVVFQKMMKL